MTRNRSRQAETEDINPRRLKRGAVKRVHVDRWAIGRDELAPGVVGDTHLGPRVVNETHLHPDLSASLAAGITVTLSADSQAIPSGGAAIELTDIVTGPRRLGFESLSLPLSAVEMPTNAVATVHVRFQWDDWRHGGTVQLKRDGTVVDECPQSWGPRFEGVLHAGSVNAGESLAVVVDHGDTGPHDVIDVQVRVKVEGSAQAGTPSTTQGIYSVTIIPGGDSPVADMLAVRRITADGTTILTSPAFSSAPDTWYGIRVSIVEGRIRARAWPWGTAEPSSWLVDVTDPEPLAAGLAGLFGSATTTTEGQRQYDLLEVSQDGADPASTDFSEYAAGEFPSGWQRLYGSGALWEVAEVAGATGGKVMRYPTSGSSGSIVGWTAAGMGADTEVLARVRTLSSVDTVGVILRGSVLL